MDKRKKIIQAIEMENAIKEHKDSWILLKKLDELIDKIEAIKPTDLSELSGQIEDVKGRIKEPEKVDLSDIKKELLDLKEKLNEEIVYELEIV